MLVDLIVKLLPVGSVTFVTGRPNAGLLFLIWYAAFAVYELLWLLFWIPFIVSRLRPEISKIVNGHISCSHCGYDLYGTSNHCPECGNIPSKEQMNLIANPIKE
jgi:hypothetical protein